MAAETQREHAPARRRKKRILVIITVLLVLAVFCWLQNSLLTVTHYTYRNPQIPAAFDGYRIVQISDLHNAVFGRNNERLLRKIEGLSPDLIVVTGDVVDSSHTNISVALSFIERACGLAPVYYVTGNHENWLEDGERRELLEGIEAAGTVILANEAADITRDGESFTLLGLKDESLGGNALQKLTEGTDASRFQLLLAHEPQYLTSYSACSVDLVLTGHAHGGQFRLLFIGGLVAPDQGFFPEYTEGMHTDGGTSMIISRGLGNSVIPVRLCNLPEIVCVDLACGKEMTQDASSSNHG